MPVNSDFRGRAAEGGIGRFRIIKPGAGVKSAVLAAGPTDKIGRAHV